MPIMLIESVQSDICTYLSFHSPLSILQSSDACCFKLVLLFWICKPLYSVFLFLSAISFFSLSTSSITKSNELDNTGYRDQYVKSHTWRILHGTNCACSVGMNSIRRGSAEATSEIWENRNSASFSCFHANGEPVPGKFRQEAALKIHPLSRRAAVLRSSGHFADGDSRRIYLCIRGCICAYWLRLASENTINSSWVHTCVRGLLYLFHIYVYLFLFKLRKEKMGKCFFPFY